MRKFKTDDALRKMARSMTGAVVERETEDRNYTLERETTDEEKEALFNIAYGTLLEFRSIAADAMCNLRDKHTVSMKETIAINTAEYIFGRFFPTCNGYDSFWIPLMERLDAWAEESWDMTLVEWYKEVYPHDEVLAGYMNDKSTFRDLYDALQKGESVSKVIGVTDGFTRNRLFKALADISKKHLYEINDMYGNRNED